MSEPETEQPQENQGADQSADQFFADVESPAGAEAGSPAAEIARLKDEVQQANERVLRAQADFENFRKRTRRDYDEQLKYANVPLIRDILGVLDNLRRAATASTGNDQVAALRGGVELVIKQLEGVLAKYNCRPIPSVGEVFDPNFHEAISQMPSNEIAAGFVVHEATTGYQMDERVIRPSQVIVSTGPAT